MRMKRFLSIAAAVLLATLFVSAQTGDFDPKNPPEPSAQYLLKVKAEPQEAATTSGSGQYAEGTRASVRASAKSNYVFKYWTQNGEKLSQTSMSFTLTMPAADVELVAFFEYQEPTFDPKNPAEPQMIDQEYYLYLVSEPADGGSFNRNSGRKTKEGEVLSLRASPATGYQFVGWYDASGNQLGTSATLSYTMPKRHTTLTARFEYNPASPVEPTGAQTNVDNTVRYITFTDDIVKQLCLANWDKDGDGKLSEGEAAAVTSLNNVFKGQDIATFAELKYFIGLSMIEADAFRNCAKLTSLTLPESVAEIGDNAFTNCPALKTLNIPASVTHISDFSVFFNCNSLTGFTVDAASGSFCAVDGILYNKDKTELVCCPATKTGAFTVPSTVTKIKTSAFGQCTKLTGIKLSSQLREIGDAVFVGCSGLTSFDFDGGELIMGTGNFTGLSCLTDFTVSGSKNGSLGDYYRVIDGVLFSTWSDGTLSSLLAFPALHATTYSVPETVEEIGFGAFYSSGIMKLTLPSTLKTIEAYAFASCEQLKEVTAKMSKPAACEDAFVGTAQSQVTLRVPAGAKSLYQNATGWKAFSIVELPKNDLTGDGSLNYADVEALVKIVRTQDTSSAAVANPNADVNGDSKVNMADVVKLINIIKSNLPDPEAMGPDVEDNDDIIDL